MKNPQSEKLSVPASIHMAALLDQNNICKDISRAFPSIKEVLHQVQFDIATEDNRDRVGPTILAMKNILDVLAVFKTKGDLIIKQEEKK